MKIVILHFPGTNCAKDTERALRYLGFHTEILPHHKSSLPKGSEGVVLPGGFAYGDYLRPGAFVKDLPLVQKIVQAAQRGMPLLGICNGFQILTELGLLPGALLLNSSARFLCRSVWLKVSKDTSPFLETAPPLLCLPIAHKYGRYHTYRQISPALQYSSPQGEVTPAHNPNGSFQNTAGIALGNILGLMPHPERAVFPPNEGGEHILLGFRHFR